MKIAVVSRSAGFHARYNIAAVLNKSEEHTVDFINWFTPEKLKDYDWIYLLGWYAGSIDSKQEHEKIIKFDKPTIVHWAGSDVVVTGEYFKEIGDKKCLDVVFGSDNIAHLSQGEKLSKEVEKLWFSSSEFVADDPPCYPIVCPIASRLDIPEVLPMPINFNKEVTPAVSLYIPPGRPEFFHFDLCKEVADAMSEIPFIICAFQSDVGESPITENMTDWGKIGDKGMIELMSICNIHLRLVEHDGFSLSVIENMLAGRRVITNWDYPFGQKVPLEKDAIVEKINKFAYVPLQDHRAADYYRQYYGQDQYREKVFKTFKEIENGT